jgi:hypothetical protein
MDLRYTKKIFVTDKCLKKYELLFIMLNNFPYILGVKSATSLVVKYIKNY